MTSVVCWPSQKPMEALAGLVVSAWPSLTRNLFSARWGGGGVGGWGPPADRPPGCHPRLYTQGIFRGIWCSGLVKVCGWWGSGFWGWLVQEVMIWDDQGEEASGRRR